MKPRLYKQNPPPWVEDKGGENYVVRYFLKSAEADIVCVVTSKDKDRAVETASIQTKPALPRVEDRALKITLFS
ncbi:hypothetical protein C7B69_11470 [filamentous cyanobacterium Phorm 46]|nr:hypothetical protein C7B69_11470 [filamentous cyanobacterium Phorm 46]PSB46634.1 hypothetical protein C7B67_19970 [filamentous cyanobacterium Phorm 6]